LEEDGPDVGILRPPEVMPEMDEPLRLVVRPEDADAARAGVGQFEDFFRQEIVLLRPVPGAVPGCRLKNLRSVPTFP